MPTLVCVGHNTVDKYLNHGMMYPGGNEVNVAALTSKYGLSSSYVGWVGDDIYGQLIAKALKAEGVELSHCQIKQGPNTYTEIYLEGGERRFGDIRRGVGTKSTLSEDDIEFILTHKLLHTGFYSKMEEFLKQYHQEIPISFDFTEYGDEEYISEYIQYVDIAFISSETNKEVKKTLSHYYSLGPQVVIMTMGNQGAYMYDGELSYQPSIKLDEVFDTLGAGDAFISRFLVEYLNQRSREQALLLAAQSAAETCQYYGAFDHGIRIPEDDEFKLK